MIYAYNSLPTSERKNISILVVDDEAIVRDFVCDALKSASFKCESASDVKTARGALLDSRYDVVISDIKMPKQSGIDFLRWARQNAIPTPFILITGHADFDSAANAVNLGAHFFLLKPFLPAELLQCVTEALHSRARERTDGVLYRELHQQNSQLRQGVVDAVVENHLQYMATISSLANAIDARDSYTYCHSRSVSKHALRLAQRMCLDIDSQDALHIAGQVHDIGKIGVPEAILLKPSALTDEEYDIIKKHPVQGVQILSPLPAFELIIPAVRGHHERFDGKGYPDRLSGDEIPLLARILSVCDTWDAMTSDRPYRRGMLPEKALSILEKEAGHQFDPAIIQNFLDIFKSEPSALAPASP